MEEAATSNENNKAKLAKVQLDSSTGKRSGCSGSSVLATPVPSQTFPKPPAQQPL